MKKGLLYDPGEGDKTPSAHGFHHASSQTVASEGVQGPFLQKYYIPVIYM